MSNTRMPDAYVAPYNTPVYWMHEFSGELSSAVRAYLDNRVNGLTVTDEQIALIRDYICYWVNAPCWENEDCVAELTELRLSAKYLDSADEIQEWTRKARQSRGRVGQFLRFLLLLPLDRLRFPFVEKILDIGMDPL